MRIIVSGTHGLVGSALVESLERQNHSVIRLIRPSAGQAANGSAAWDPRTGVDDLSWLEGADAAVHLAGESIASGRWTAAKKSRIRDSRVLGTRNLSANLAQLKNPPKVLVSASAIGFYGDRGEEVLSESSNAGSGFLSSVCQEWESATYTAARKGIRVVHTRFGLILSPNGGALQKMLPPFKMGVGGRMGSGRQFMSWIALEDAVGVIEHELFHSDQKGPVNVVSPQPVTNAQFTRALGKALSRPTVFPMPAVAARLAFGEMADALLLSSSRVMPERLLESGYRFKYPELEGCLKAIIS